MCAFAPTNLKPFSSTQNAASYFITTVHNAEVENTLDKFIPKLEFQNRTLQKFPSQTAKGKRYFLATKTPFLVSFYLKAPSRLSLSFQMGSAIPKITFFGDQAIHPKKFLSHNKPR